MLPGSHQSPALQRKWTVRCEGSSLEWYASCTSTVLSLATLRLCLGSTVCLRQVPGSGSGERYALVDCAGGTPKRLLKRVNPSPVDLVGPLQHALLGATSTVHVRISVTRSGPEPGRHAVGFKFIPAPFASERTQSKYNWHPPPSCCHRTTELGRRLGRLDAQPGTYLKTAIGRSS